MSSSALILGGISFSVFGLGMSFYSFSKLSENKRIIKNAAVIPINITDVRIEAVKKGTRFPRTEFLPIIEYNYVVDSQPYISKKTFVVGDQSFKKRKDAENEVKKLKSFASAYYDPLNPKNSFVIPHASPSARAHVNGLIGSGAVLFMTGIALFWAGI